MAAETAKPVTTRTGRAAVPGRDPILSSKITVPGVADWVLQRPRIMTLIARGTRWHPLTLVTGPPGAGKTMALATWAAAESAPVAWISLDEYDDRPGVFWSYFVAALRRSGVTLSKVQAPASRGRTAEHLFLLRLAEALAAQDPPVTLVLDDFHLISQSRLLDGLDFVLRNTGAGLRLVICSRMDPLLPLYRYRLAGQLAEIRAGDLAFTVGEAGLMLAQHGTPLSTDSLEYLTQRTEGWAAGIRLAALSMDAHPDPAQFVKELTAGNNALTSYLMEEVLNGKPPEVQEVLLSTSILENVSPECASEVAGDSRAAAVLADLAHANAFVWPIGDGWYRYHTMFAEVLRLKLRLRSPDRVPGLHRRAALWYQRNGRPTEAVRHAVRVGDWQLAAATVIDALAVGQLFDPRRGQSLAAEFAGMPPWESWETPAPCLIAAALALTGEGLDSAATAALVAAEGMLNRLPDGEQTAARLAAALIRIAAARRAGNLAAAAAAAASAESLLHDMPSDDLTRYAAVRAHVLCQRGAVEMWSGRFDDAARTLRSGVMAAATSGSDYERTDCLGQLALAEALRGRLGHSGELAEEATAVFSHGECGPLTELTDPATLLATAWPCLADGGWRDPTDLLKRLNTALSVSPDKLLGAMACLIAAHVGLAEGHAATAGRYLAKARSGWSVPPWLDKRLSLAESEAAMVTCGRGQRLSASAQGDPGPASSRASGHETAPLIVEPLTEREQEVLRHVSRMLSTAEVASEMYISTNTVKTHLKSIFRKLAAGHRGEAVRRARELQLI